MPTNDPNNPGILRRIGRGIGNRIGTQARGIRNALPGNDNFDWRQMLDVISEPFVPGNLYASQNAPGDRFIVNRGANNVRGFLNRFGGSDPGQPLPGDPNMPLPNYPGAAPAQISGMGPLAQYGYQDPNAVGPPEYLAGNGGMVSRQDPSRHGPGRASPSSGAGRMGGTTIATDGAAIAMARGMAGTGLGGGAGGGAGASSVGRDLLMRRYRQG